MQSFIGGVIPLKRRSPWHAGVSVRARGVWVRCAALLVFTVAAQAKDNDPDASFRKLDEGVFYKHDRVASEPWSIHIARMDRSNALLTLHTTLAHDMIVGTATLSEQVAAVPATVGRVIAAVNGDFFRFERTIYNGDPHGLMISGGELISLPTDRFAFWIDAKGEPHAGAPTPELKVTWANGDTLLCGLNEERRAGAVLFTPRIGPSTFSAGGTELILERDGDGPWLPLRPGVTYAARVRQVRPTGNTRMTNDVMVLSLGRNALSRIPSPEVGAQLKITAKFTPDLTDAPTAIGGGPILVRDGKTVEQKRPTGSLESVPYSIHSMFTRHPRTAVGWNARYFFLIQVDGRQPGLSMGMTLQELSDYMRAQLSCEHAVNLDGGGSATFWAGGRVRNSPADGEERPMANALVIVRKPK